jgi:hypothetical protein
MKKAIELLESQIPLRVRDVKNLMPEWASGIENKLFVLLAELRDDARAWEASRRDPDRSDIGRRKETERISNAALQRLTMFETAHVAAIKDQAQFVQAAIFKKTHPVKPQNLSDEVWEMRQREVRDDLRRLDASERDAVLGALSDPSLDPVVVAAIQSAPPALVTMEKNSRPVLRSFVTPDKLAAARVERARALAPQEVKELDALNAVVEMYGTTLGMVRSAIVEESSPKQSGFRDPVTGKPLPEPTGARR